MDIILDLDGVIWLAEEPIAGSADAVGRLRAARHRLLFLTNNSNPTVKDLVEKLGSMGIEAEGDEIVNSSRAAASLLEPETTALVFGGPGVVEALEERGVKPVFEGDADAVVVGFTREFDFERLTLAMRAVMAGARLIGTNHDPTYPTPDGPVPGGGSLIAAVATAAGVDAVVAGKPNEAMQNLVKKHWGDDLSDAVLVGDRPSTDGVMARRLGMRFALMLSGVSSEEADPEDVDADAIAPDLGSFVGEQGELQELA